MNSSILGKQLFLNNKDALIITGLIEDAPANTSLQYSMLIPYEFFRINNPYYASNWSGNYQGTTFIVMNERKRRTKWKKFASGMEEKVPETGRRSPHYI